MTIRDSIKNAPQSELSKKLFGEDKNILICLFAMAIEENQ